MLMLTVRESQPHNHARMQALLAAGGVSGAFGRAVGYIERHLASDIGLADIVAAACCSPRTLAGRIQAAGEVSPMRYVHRLRLDRIRAELLAPPAGRNVAEIAFAWGHRHRGDFNRQYRAAFGETPSRRPVEVV
jgi:transcriptional regulator GlxA family with amidase domain